MDINIRKFTKFVDKTFIEGGKEGEFYEDIVDYFYYAQLRSQPGGEHSTSERNMTGKIPLAEIPNMMRALGFYPTEQEVENMCSEVKYSRFTETGQTVDMIGMDDFIRLYVNHRPVFGIGKEQIAEAIGA